MARLRNKINSTRERELKKKATKGISNKQSKKQNNYSVKICPSKTKNNKEIVAKGLGVVTRHTNQQLKDTSCKNSVVVIPLIKKKENETNNSSKNDNAKTRNYVGRDNDIQNLLNSIDETEEPKEVEKEKFIEKTTKKCLPYQSTRISSRRLSKVYDFSQEKTIEDHDPTRDIVKELIKEGKVRVATCAKGKGKPIIKKRPPIKNKEKLKPIQLVQVAVLHENVPMPDNIDSDTEYNNDTFSAHVESPVMNSTPPHSPLQSPVHGESTFSDLARSVLLNRTGKKYMHTKEMNKIDLVSAVRKFVSTPIKNKSESSQPSLNRCNFSTINLPGSTPYNKNGHASPWRVDNSSKLPGVFNFSCNSSNLPSFSCDYIAPENNEIVENSVQISSKSNSLSTNDSNAENIAPQSPSKVPNNNNTNNINENLLNLRQQSNPRYGNSNRSPLKAINIIEVIQLPSWKTTEKEKNGVSINSQATSLTKSFKDKTLCKNNNQSKKKNNCMTKDKVDLFGFDEFIDDNTDNTDHDEEVTNVDTSSNNNNTSSNNTLCQKLLQLKKWRPNIIQKHEKPTTETQKSTGTHLFMGIDGEEKKQRFVNEMLCSTMINTNAAPSTSRQTHNRESVNLFRENSVENSFDDNAAHRTYVRPYKRKRKLRQNLVMYMDSDESGEEESIELEGQDIPKRKYQRKDAPDNTELNQFVTEFNSMCNEVQRFPLMVEKEV